MDNVRATDTDQITRLSGQDVPIGARPILLGGQGRNAVDVLETGFVLLAFLGCGCAAAVILLAG